MKIGPEQGRSPRDTNKAARQSNLFLSTTRQELAREGTLSPRVLLLLIISHRCLQLITKSLLQPRQQLDHLDMKQRAFRNSFAAFLRDYQYGG